MLFWLWTTLAVLAGLNLTRKAVDLVARLRHWRVRRWGPLLCIFGRKGGACLRCRTDWRWPLPHDTPYSEDGRCVFPLCEACWQELDVDGRLHYYALMLTRWRKDGRYVLHEGGEDTERWDEERTAIYAAVEAGL